MTTTVGTNIHVGTFSTMGWSHKENQDYGILTNSGLVISDGCSSAPFSSVGARILTHSIESLRPQDLVGWNAVLENCATICGRLNLPLDCLCATLIWAEYNKDTNSIELRWVGDGTIATRSRHTNEINIETISFNSGAPYYLRYEIGSREGYIKEFGDLYNENRSYFMDFPNGIISRSYDMELYDLVSIFSDGVGSLDLPIQEVVEEMLKIKGFAGDFMYRRGNAAINKFGQNDKFPYDDFTVGIIKVD